MALLVNATPNCSTTPPYQSCPFLCISSQFHYVSCHSQTTPSLFILVLRFSNTARYESARLGTQPLQHRASQILHWSVLFLSGLFLCCSIQIMSPPRLSITSIRNSTPLHFIAAPLLFSSTPLLHGSHQFGSIASPYFSTTSQFPCISYPFHDITSPFRYFSELFNSATLRHVTFPFPTPPSRFITLPHTSFP